MQSASRPALPHTPAQAGFSLLEVIIVLAIMGTLIGFLVSSLGGSQVSAKKKETALRAGQIYSQLLRLQTDIGKLPTTAEGLGALWNNPGNAKWSGPYLQEDEVKDGFGAPFEYELQGRGAKLSSPGEDGQLGTGDDLIFINGREAKEAGGEKPADGANP